MDRIQLNITREQADVLLTLLQQDVPNEYYEQGRADSPRWKHMLTHRIDLLNGVRSELERVCSTPGRPLEDSSSAEGTSGTMTNAAASGPDVTRPDAF